MMNDPLANLLTAVKNADRVGKPVLTFKPVSQLMTRVLAIFKEHDYIKEFEMVEDHKGGIYRIVLSQKINDCGAIKPRFPIKKDEFLRWERRFLPAKDFGLVVVSTSQGVMTHTKAKKAGLGGKLIAYIY